MPQLELLAMSLDSIKPELELALLSFLRGHHVFVSLPIAYEKSLFNVALPAAFDELLKTTSPSRKCRCCCVSLDPSREKPGRLSLDKRAYLKSRLRKTSKGALIII